MNLKDQSMAYEDEIKQLKKHKVPSIGELREPITEQYNHRCVV